MSKKNDNSDPLKTVMANKKFQEFLKNMFKNNSPEEYEQFSSDPEWTDIHSISINDIVGALAKWSIQKNSSYLSILPANLETVLKYTSACLTQEAKSGKIQITKYEDETIQREIALEISLYDLRKKLWEILGDFPQFVAWKETVVDVDLTVILHYVCLEVKILDLSD